MQASVRGNHADELVRRAGRFDGVLEMFAGEERSAAPSDTAIRYPDRGSGGRCRNFARQRESI